MSDEKILLTIQEAGERVGLGRSKLYELIGAGEIPVARIGRAVRIPARALEVWAERQVAEEVGT